MSDRLAVSSKELPELLGCGRRSARKVGEAAGAKVRIGGRVLWNVHKLQTYLDQAAERGNDEEML